MPALGCTPRKTLSVFLATSFRGTGQNHFAAMCRIMPVMPPRFHRIGIGKPSSA
jgi:hypothetical protein